MGEGIVPDVVQQRGQLQAHAVRGIEPEVARGFELRQRAAREVVRAERVLEAAMRGAGIDEERVPQLTDVTQPLDGGGVDHGQRFGIEPDVVPERVADDLEPGHDGCLGGNPIPVAPRPRPRRARGPGTERSSPGTSARAAPPGHRTPPGRARCRAAEARPPARPGPAAGLRLRTRDRAWWGCGRASRRTPPAPWRAPRSPGRDPKSTRLNSSHVRISYAVLCLQAA